MSYYKKIDGLRFIAILLVLLEHFTPISSLISAGYFGVDLFFVMSGFLITGILLKPNDNSFGSNYFKFLGRRTLRIFPIYYLTILVLWLVGHPVVVEYLGWFLTYSYNYAWPLYGIANNSVNHFWSLAVEEQFYLFWPIVVILLRNKGNYLFVVMMVIIVFGYSQMVFKSIEVMNIYNLVGLPTRMASLVLGSLGALMATRGLLPDRFFNNSKVEFFVFVVLVIALATDLSVKPLVLGLCSFYIVLKAAYYKFSIAPIENFLNRTSIVKIGTLAYGIYIFHMPMEEYLTRYLFDPIWMSIDFSSLGVLEKLRWQSWIIKFPVYSVLSVMLAYLSFERIEKPILKLKDKYFK